MLYKRQGVPEVDEIVFCKVTKIYPNSVFVDLEEFPNKTGMIYISEIAPGRIRNLRDYVDVGRQIVCKVLKVDYATGNIDLSLRRVNSVQKAEKLEEIKQELKAEALLKSVSEKLKKPMYDLYEKISKKIFASYSHLYLCFKDVANSGASLEKLGIDKDLAHELTQAISEKFRPPKVEIGGDISLTTYASDGLDRIKKVLADIVKVSPAVKIAYLGGGKYKLSIEDVDYKAAEKNLDKVKVILDKFNDKVSTAVFDRVKQDN